MKHNNLFLLLAVALLSACSANDETPVPDAQLEIRGIQVAVDGEEPAALTRAAAEGSAASVVVGRKEFVKDDKIVFTTIRRTTTPLTAFTYSGISYQNDGSKWVRCDNGPDKIYWSDGSSAHTFVGYSLPSATYNFVQPGGAHAGELGGASSTEVDYTTGTAAMAAEDLLLCYDLNTKAETGGLSTKVRFAHALSNVCVVVNTTDFIAGELDKKVEVSNMVISHQPARFTWSAKGTNLDMAPSDQIYKTIKLYQNGFSFYGITTPYTGDVPFSFTVKYPDATQPDKMLTKTYKGTFSNVKFHSGQQTTLTITLNHRDEQMHLGVDYHDWNYRATPDLGLLRKKSTFMTMSIDEVTIHNQSGLTIDDATWLYSSGDRVMYIYGNTGSSAEDAYVIKSAAQLLSLAKEVNDGAMDFEKKFIRLDADITMQKSTTDTGNVWQGIGTSDKPFQGTFLGGDRFINRLNGSGLFGCLDSLACVEQLQITTVGSIQGGALAVSNAGIIGGCRVVDDITTDGGALVGTNTGTVHACYCTGDITVGETTGGTLIGNGGDKAVGCYIASEITSFTETSLKGKVAQLNAELNNLYTTDFKRTKFKFSHVPANYPVVQPLH